MMVGTVRQIVRVAQKPTARVEPGEITAFHDFGVSATPSVVCSTSALHVEIVAPWGSTVTFHVLVGSFPRLVSTRLPQ
jgi:hypothetical protein